MRVLGRETEAVVFLEVLIGSHTVREERSSRVRGQSQDKSPIIKLWQHKHNTNIPSLIILHGVAGSSSRSRLTSGGRPGTT